MRKNIEEGESGDGGADGLRRNGASIKKANPGRRATQDQRERSVKNTRKGKQVRRHSYGRPPRKTGGGGKKKPGAG